MKVHAQPIKTLVLSQDTSRSEVEQFFTGRVIHISRNTYGEILFVEVDGVTYQVGEKYSKLPDGTICEYVPHHPLSYDMVCEDYIQREIGTHGSGLKLNHAVKGGYTVTGFNTHFNPSNVFCGMEVGSVDELNIQFQSGAIVDGQWNGITNEVLLAIVLDRLQLFQAGEYPCDQNEKAIKGIQHAIDSLLDRTSPVSSNSVVTPREDSIYRLKSIFEGWSGPCTDKLIALELLLAENKIQIGGLVEGRKSLIFKYINDPKGEWWIVSIDEICEPSRTKWQLTGDGYTTMVNHHPIFDHDIIPKEVL